MKLSLILLMFFLLFSCKQEKKAADPGVYYTCSMDPQVVSDAPGTCPICKMELTAVRRNGKNAAEGLQLSEQQVKLGNIHTDTLRKGSLNDELVLSGMLNMDGRKLYTISARIMGRIEKLYVRSVGDYVAKGMPLYELYSEELNQAKQEYIMALKRKQVFTDASMIDFDQLITAARSKLKLWGLTGQQILSLEQLQQAPLTTTFYSTEAGYVTAVDITEGSYVAEGSTILQVADLSTLWVEAQVFPSQLSGVYKTAVAKVEVPGTGLTVNGRTEFTSPALDPGARVNTVRITIPNPGNRLKPGMPAYARYRWQGSSAIYLPSDAVIRDGRGATVWLQKEKNHFINKMVTTGMENNGFVEIRHGLQPGDVVVTSGAYLLNSEYFFKKGSEVMEGHEH